MRFEGALPERREVVPRSFVKDAEGKRLLCGDFGRPPPRPSRSRLRRRRVCVCVCATTAAARVCRLLPDASIEHLRERPGRAGRPFPVWDSIEGL